MYLGTNTVLIFWQTVKTQISSGSALFAKIKTIFRDRNTSFCRNFDQQPLKIQSGLNSDFILLFYSQIQDASQSKKGLYFPNLGDFFPTWGFYWDLFPNSKDIGCLPRKAIKSLGLFHIYCIKMYGIIHLNEKGQTCMHSCSVQIDVYILVQTFIYFKIWWVCAGSSVPRLINHSISTQISYAGPNMGLITRNPDFVACQQQMHMGVFRIIPEFKILRLTYHRKSA